MSAFVLDSADLRPLVLEVTRELLAQNASAILPTERIGYPEREAAQLIGVKWHVLRDARLRGEVRGKFVGKRIVYERGELLRYLADQEGSR
jgi:hypothetical protein